MPPQKTICPRQAGTPLRLTAQLIQANKTLQRQVFSCSVKPPPSHASLTSKCLVSKQYAPLIEKGKWEKMVYVQKTQTHLYVFLPPSPPTVFAV